MYTVSLAATQFLTFLLSFILHALKVTWVEAEFFTPREQGAKRRGCYPHTAVNSRSRENGLWPKSQNKHSQTNIIICATRGHSKFTTCPEQKEIREISFRDNSSSTLFSGQHSYLQTICNRFAAIASDWSCWEKIEKKKEYFFRNRMPNCNEEKCYSVN